MKTAAAKVERAQLSKLTYTLVSVNTKQEHVMEREARNLDSNSISTT